MENFGTTVASTKGLVNRIKTSNYRIYTVHGYKYNIDNQIDDAYLLCVRVKNDLIELCAATGSSQQHASYMK